MYAVKNAEYKEQMELMLRRSLLPSLGRAAPPEPLLRTIKLEPSSPPRSRPRNRDIEIGCRVKEEWLSPPTYRVKEERLSPPPTRSSGGLPHAISAPVIGYCRRSSNGGDSSSSRSVVTRT